MYMKIQKPAPTTKNPVRTLIQFSFGLGRPFTWPLARRAKARLLTALECEPPLARDAMTTGTAFDWPDARIACVWWPGAVPRPTTLTGAVLGAATGGAVGSPDFCAQKY